MKKILCYLREHIRVDFHLATYLLVAIFLVITTTLNYWFDFEDSVIDSYYGQPVYFLWYFLFYSFAYFGTVILMSIDPANKAFLQNKLFWVLSLAGIAILALDGGFYFQQPLADSAPEALQNYTLKILNNVYSIFTILLPLLILYVATGDRSTGFYGIAKVRTNWRPYLYMLLIMAPLIGAASFSQDFQGDYPSYPDTWAHLYLDIPEWVTALLFELVYGWDFVATEWIFRGFFVIGMASVMGHRAVLPMVVTYAFLHYGKPLGETIGSVFGGYILGVIALRTGSIWGGIAIHLGVAWLMEIAAFLQRIGK